MKKVLFVLVLSAMLLSTIGCSGVGYNARERHQQIGRVVSLEGAMMVDDLDRLFLLRPVSGMSPWFVKP